MMAAELPTVRFALMWHSMNSDNLGVGALTLGNIAILRKLCASAGVRPLFTVIGWRDSRSDYFKMDDVEVVRLQLRDFARPVGGLLSQLASCDIVIDIGAGDSFTDIYGAKRFSTILAPKIMSVLARRPLILAPQTIGPFGRARYRSLGLLGIRAATVVSTRDDLSTDFLRDLGYRGEIIAASDVALHLPYEPRMEEPEGAKVRFGLNVSGLLMSGGYSGDNMFGLQSSYSQTIRQLIEALTERSEIEVHLVGHVISDTSEVEDDYRANLRLAETFPSIVLAPKFADPIAAKSYISRLDAFAGARMHACIAAFSTNVPVLPMAYSRKFAGFFGSLGYDLLADCRTDGSDEILKKVEHLISNRAHVRTTMGAALEKGLERLANYEVAVAHVLSTVTASRTK